MWQIKILIEKYVGIVSWWLKKSCIFIPNVVFVLYLKSFYFFYVGSLQEALDQNMLKSIEQLVSQAKSDTTPPIPIANKVVSPHTSPHKIVSLILIYLLIFYSFVIVFYSIRFFWEKMLYKLCYNFVT